jgi:hypothetical protein
MCSFAQIEGVFEIHISVKPEQVFKLWSFTAEKKNIKLILASSSTGTHPNQLMISKFTNGKYENVIEKAKHLAKEMEEYGLDIIRLKVESLMHNEGVPISELDYQDLITCPEIIGTPYFEFHVKFDIDNQQSSKDYLTKIDELTKQFITKDIKIAHSVNVCGSKNLMLTIRIYNYGRKYAVDTKNKILDSLKDQRIKFMDNIQQEFSVFDNNENLDQGWLI